MNETKKKEMETLIEALNEASSAYYNGATSAMSDREWDAMFDQLKKMEEETGVVYSNFLHGRWTRQRIFPCSQRFSGKGRQAWQLSCGSWTAVRSSLPMTTDS